MRFANRFHEKKFYPEYYKLRKCYRPWNEDGKFKGGIMEFADEPNCFNGKQIQSKIAKENSSVHKI